MPSVLVALYEESAACFVGHSPTQPTSPPPPLLAPLGTKARRIAGGHGAQLPLPALEAVAVALAESVEPDGVYGPSLAAADLAHLALASSDCCVAAAAGLEALAARLGDEAMRHSAADHGGVCAALPRACGWALCDRLVGAPTALSAAELKRVAKEIGAKVTGTKAVVALGILTRLGLQRPVAAPARVLAAVAIERRAVPRDFWRGARFCGCAAELRGLVGRLEGRDIRRAAGFSLPLAAFHSVAAMRAHLARARRIGDLAALRALVEAAEARAPELRAAEDARAAEARAAAARAAEARAADARAAAARAAEARAAAAARAAEARAAAANAAPASPAAQAQRRCVHCRNVASPLCPNVSFLYAQSSCFFAFLQHILSCSALFVLRPFLNPATSHLPRALFLPPTRAPSQGCCGRCCGHEATAMRPCARHGFAPPPQAPQPPLEAQPQPQQDAAQQQEAAAQPSSSAAAAAAATSAEAAGPSSSPTPAPAAAAASAAAAAQRGGGGDGPGPARALNFGDAANADAQLAAAAAAATAAAQQGEAAGLPSQQQQQQQQQKQQ